MIYVATGHRPNKLGGYGNVIKNRLASVAWFRLKADRPDRVISGMAQGWDQAVALAAFHLEIPLWAAVPFVGQEKNWPFGAQHIYNELLSKAAKVNVVSDGGYEPWKMFKRNEWMVDQLEKPEDRLLALWNGEHVGGTWDAIKYAEDKGKTRINLWPEWEKLNGKA